MRILHSKKLIFVSKPRCGSTSIRNALTQRMEEGDVSCNVPNLEEGLHPHMSAPAIKKYIARKGGDPDEYYTFTVTRNPLEMLWSYYKYFQPDRGGKYNYNDEHDINQIVPFEEWLEFGRVGIGESWKEFVPHGVTHKNLSPLSLEAHICDGQGEVVVNNWYMLENLTPCVEKLSEIFGEAIEIPSVNASKDDNFQAIDFKLMKSLAKQFPTEFEMYNIRY